MNRLIEFHFHTILDRCQLKSPAESRSCVNHTATPDLSIGGSLTSRRDPGAQAKCGLETCFGPLATGDVSGSGISDAVRMDL